MGKKNIAAGTAVGPPICYGNKGIVVTVTPEKIATVTSHLATMPELVEIIENITKSVEITYPRREKAYEAILSAVSAGIYKNAYLCIRSVFPSISTAAAQRFYGAFRVWKCRKDADESAIDIPENSAGSENREHADSDCSDCDIIGKFCNHISQIEGEQLSLIKENINTEMEKRKKESAMERGRNDGKDSLKMNRKNALRRKNLR